MPHGQEPRRRSTALCSLFAVVVLVLPSCSPDTSAVAEQEPTPTTPAVVRQASSAKKRLLYVHRNGGKYKRSPKGPQFDDARINRSMMLNITEATVPGSSLSNADWSTLMSCVREIFAPFNVEVTDVEPRRMLRRLPKTHMEIVMTSHPSVINQDPDVGGVATRYPNASTADNGVGWVFEDQYGSVIELCETVAHEAGHLFGLDHVMQHNDVMSYFEVEELRGFQDVNSRCATEDSTPKPKQCTVKNPLTGNFDTQNTFDFLKRRVGQVGNGTRRATARHAARRDLVHQQLPSSSVARAGNGCGYWHVRSDGKVVALNAPYHGGAEGIVLNQPITAIASRPQGDGYWLVGEDGGVFSYGNAGYFGSAADLLLNETVVGIAPTPDGQGYWLVASDGGVFTYGNAGFFGSAANISLNKPVVGLVPTRTGQGYWLVAADGGVFTFGDAPFHGSAPERHFSDPVVGLAPTPDNGGYWLMTAEGATLAFGNASTQCVTPPPPPPPPPPCGTLPAGYRLNAGESVTSCNGVNRLVMQTDGNLVLFRNGGALWTSGTPGSGANVARMQADGNLVLHAPWGAVWASNTFHGGSRLVVQDDSNLLIFNSANAAVWSTDTCGLLTGDMSLHAGQNLTSCDGRFTLWMQGDGNLVLYHNGVAPIWSSGTSGTGSNVAVVQSDGNFVVYSPWGATWASWTNGYSWPRLKAQNDGNLVLYQNGRAIWSSGTPGR
jgi:hypothetical protein